MEPEKILACGVEGGGVTIYRTANPSGGWTFHLDGNSIQFEPTDDDDWEFRKVVAIPTFEEALLRITGDDTWILYYPIMVHPEYQPTVWERALAAADKLPERSRRQWGHTREYWQRECGQGQE